VTTVTVVDESTAGARAAGWPLEIAERRPTLRELIRRRVYREVAEHNATGAPLRGPVQAVGAGGGGGGSRPARGVDPRRQYELALAAFARNGFVVLVGDRQVVDLDEAVDLAPGTEVTFLRLVPLVGG
jgi:hypothetical protein